MELDAKFKTEEIERRLDALPSEVADAFESERTAKIIFDAGRERGLAIDKIGEVAKLVGYAMLGFVPASEFTSAVADIVGDKKNADDLAAAINQKIFLPIREAMKQAYGSSWAEGPSTGSSTTLPARPPAARPASPPPASIARPAEPVPPARGPEPLIIRPLPSPPREAEVSGQRIADRKQPMASNAAAPAPAARTTFEEKPAAPPVMAKPPPSPAPKPFETLPPRALGKPASSKSAAIEPAAPVISPLGSRPSSPPSQAEASRPTLSPPPPASSYERAREQVKKELAVFQPAPAPAAPARPTEPPSSPITTGELLRQEIEKFRPQQPPPPLPLKTPAVESPAPALPPPPSQRPAPPPLKLPPQKIPKPQAPEKYNVDPYKEPPE